MDRSLRRRGQVMVVTCALLGGLIGVASGLLMHEPQTSTALAAPDRGRGAALAADAPGGRSGTAAGSGEPAAGQASSERRRAEPVDKAGKRAAKAGKKGQGDKGDGHGEGKPGKGKKR